MNQINLELPRSALVTHVAVAGLAAVGMMSLVPAPSGPGKAMVGGLMLTVLLAMVMVLRTRDAVDRARQEAGQATTTDPRTGIATAAAGDQVLGLEFAAAQRGRPLAVVLIRVEQLGRYRAEHGRVVTDKLLRDSARTLGRHRRGMHLAAPYSGDSGTFLSILSGSDRDGAAVYATRVRRALLQRVGPPRPAGISVGIAVFDMSMQSPRDLVRRAEFALNKGAAAGGKVVVVGGDAPVEA